MAIVFVDGECILCEKMVRFLIHHDSSQCIRFASLQGKTGSRFVNPVYIRQMRSVIVILRNGVFVQKSNAIIELGQLLDLPRWLIAAFSAIPVFLRDAVYDLIAACRYRFFAKKDWCSSEGAVSKVDRWRFLP